jgi:rhodanese-related sulfurtransferase
MTKYLRSALAISAFALLASISLAQQPADSNTSKAHILKVAELDKLLTHPEKILFIDVRRPDEVSSIGSFPVYLSVQLKDLESSLNWIPKDRTIVTVSNHANRAAKAADVLVSKGFKVAGAVGSQTYEQDGGKWVTHIAIPPKPAAAVAKAEATKQ